MSTLRRSKKLRGYQRDIEPLIREINERYAGEVAVQTIEKESRDFQIITELPVPATYIIRCKNFYKIGFTRGSVLNRIEQFKTGNPFEISVVFVVLTERCEELEKKLHEEFKHRTHRGEWFDLQPEDEDKITSVLLEFICQKG